MTQQEIFDAVKSWLDGDGWHSSPRGGHILEMGVSLKCSGGQVRVFVDARSTFYLVYVMLPVNGKKNSAQLLEFLTMANYGLLNGNFEMDVRDGEIRYKTFVNCDGMDKLSAEVIQDSILQGLFTVQKYGDCIARLCLFPGESTALAEIQKCEPRQARPLDDVK